MPTTMLAAIDERDGALGVYVSVAGEPAARAVEAADGDIAGRGDAAWRDRLVARTERVGQGHGADGGPVDHPRLAR